MKRIMTNGHFIILIAIYAISISGCRGNNSSSEVTVFPTNMDTTTPLVATPIVEASSTLTPSQSLNKTPTETITSEPRLTDVSTALPASFSETRFLIRCLEVQSEMPLRAISDGIVMLGRGFVGQDRRYETILLDMNTRETTTISFLNEAQLDHEVSVDKTLIAYSRFIYDKNGNKVKHLVIAAANGQIQKEVPWDEKWAYLLRWTVDKRLLLTYDDPNLHTKENLSTVFAYLLLDPFSAEKEIVLPVFPEYLTNGKIPYWDGWFGAVYDPTATRAIYPKVINEKDEFYTYNLWDVHAQEPVASFENIFVDWVGSSIAAPMPSWAEDGSRFSFVGFDYLNDESKFELYGVSRDGEIEQLINLTSIDLFRDFTITWSTDGKKIAMILDRNPEVDGENVFVLDLETKEITDTCISVTGNPSAYETYPLLIWSPNGQQFLVKDWLDDYQNQIILVDIEKGFAAKVFENVDLNGWMIYPEE